MTRLPGLRWLIVLGAVGLAGCAHRTLDKDSLDQVRRLAIVTRAPAAPRVELDSASLALASQGAEQSEKQLAAALARQVPRFEVQERLRTSLLQRLPANPPWTTAMPAIEVATALETLLVDDRSEPNYATLARYGADAVLELWVQEYGVHQVGGRTGIYVKGKGRLFELGGSTIWKAPIELDEAADPEGTGLELTRLGAGEWREAIISALGRVADTTAAQLAPSAP